MDSFEDDFDEEERLNFDIPPGAVRVVVDRIERAEMEGVGREDLEKGD